MQGRCSTCTHFDLITRLGLITVVFRCSITNTRLAMFDKDDGRLLYGLSL